MRSHLFLAAVVLALSGCASIPTYQERMALSEVSGEVESWSNSGVQSSSTIWAWKEDIQGSDYALVQLRVSLDTYRFALSREHVDLVLDAIDNYQSISKQTSAEIAPAIGWLARADIKLKRLGGVAKDDKLIINVEREQQSQPFLVLTFESWLLSFKGPDSPADRAYKQVSYTPEQVASLRALLEEVRSGM